MGKLLPSNCKNVQATRVCWYFKSCDTQTEADYTQIAVKSLQSGIFFSSSADSPPSHMLFFSLMQLALFTDCLLLNEQQRQPYQLAADLPFPCQTLCQGYRLTQAWMSSSCLIIMSHKQLFLVPLVYKCNMQFYLCDQHFIQANLTTCHQASLLLLSQSVPAARYIAFL